VQATRRVCIIALREYTRIREVVQKEVAQLVNTASLLSISSCSVYLDYNSNNTAVLLAANTQLSSKKYT
jgi:hypothetical protein